MRNFFKTVLATMVGFLLFSMLWVVIGLIMVGVITASFQETKKAPLNKASILEIKIENTVPDRAVFDLVEQLSFNAAGKPIGLNHLLKAISRAKSDPYIKGIVLYSGLSASISCSQVQEVRSALKEFKKSGKFVYAYAEAYGSQNAYWLASMADTICLQPQGALEWKGLHLEVMFYKDLLQKFNLEMQIVRHGKFKSAVEPFMQTKMSDANREQYNRMAQSIWLSMSEDVAQSRKMSMEEVNQAATELYGLFPQEALKHKMIDMVAPYHVFQSMLMNKMGISKAKDLERVSISDYVSIDVPLVKTSDKIAVVYASGEIGMSKGSDKEIGTENVIKALQEAVEDNDVKAIVLRVNSPGGSVLTSDMIYWEVLEAQKKKPVIASFGTYAASGGYYISCASRRIFAEPTTLTGSIGVFGMIPNVGKAADKLGIDFDEVNTHANSGYISLRRPMTATEKKMMQRNIEGIYGGFVAKVATGRKMTTEAVDSIGQGRVWTGADAIKIGLVDELGGLTDAIKYAAKVVKIEDFNIVAYPKAKSSYEYLMENVKNVRLRSAYGVIEDYAGSDAKALLQTARLVNDSRTGVVMARIPYGITIE